MPPFRQLTDTGVGFAVYVGRRFLQDDCLRHATALAYATLLSLVPLLTVGFSVLAAFPVFETITEAIQQFIFRNLVPASGELVQDYIQRFMSKAAELTAVGTVGLVVGALLMISAIDQALNDIWHVHQRRRPVQGFLVYWTVLTLSPVLLGASLAASSYLFTTWVVSEVKQAVLAALPFLAEWLAYALLYATVPNRRVPLRHAVLGALVAAVLFELAKSAFGFYVRSVPAYEVIYGALAAIPLFLVWLYLSWLVVLLGAEFTQALSTYPLHRGGGLADPRQALVLAVRVLGHLWHAQRQGVGLQRSELHRREPLAGELALQQVLTDMARARLVVRTERGGWTLVRDLHDLTLFDIYRSSRYLLPDPARAAQRDAWDRRLLEALSRAEQGVEQALSPSLAELLAEEVGPAARSEANQQEAES